jgi:hypothetical protein
MPLPFKNKIVILLVLFIATFDCFTQGGFKQKYYLQGSDASVSRDVVETPSGNLVIIGLTSENGFNRLTLLGTDSQGAVLWRKNYGDSNFQYLDNWFATKSTLYDNSGFYYTCSVMDSVGGNYSVLIRFNYSGDTLWQKIYKDVNYSLISQAVAKSVDGGLLLTGFFQNATDSPALLMKTDANGNELWQKKINKVAPNTQDGASILQDSATKKIIIVGYQYIGNANSWNTYSNILILDSLGTVLQQTTFNNADGGSFGCVIQTKDKNFLTCGSVNAFNDLGNFTRYRNLVVKFDINGNALWSNTYDTLSPYTGIGILNELPNGDIMMLGTLDTMLNHNLPAVVSPRLLKIDQNGNLKWKRYIGNFYNTITNEGVHSMNPTQDGGFIIAEWFPYGSNPTPYNIVKIDSTGCDTIEAYCHSIALGINNFTKLTGYDFSVFPNPAKDVVHIKLDASYGNSAIKITDALGRQLEYKIPDRGNDAEINIAGYNSGVYFVEALYEQHVIAAKQLIIIK